MASSSKVRVRDPERRERILTAAAELIARRGYMNVSLDDIGSAAGIVGSGVYRHFDTKVSILVEMFDRVVDRLVAEAETMVRLEPSAEVALGRLLRGQVDFTLGERTLCEVYLQESRNLPIADQRRLRWKQRHYVDLWQDLLRTLRPELDSAHAQQLAHAAIGSVHSVLRYRSTLGHDDLAAALEVTGAQIMGIRPHTARAETAGPQ